MFLEKTPHNIDVTEIKEHIEEIDGIIDVHHIHIWSLDMHNNFATMHIVADDESHKIKNAIREVRGKRNYPEHFTDTQIVKDLEKHYSNIRELALYDFNQFGAEGQVSMGENGVNRTWKSRNDCLIGVFAYCT